MNKENASKLWKIIFFIEVEKGKYKDFIISKENIKKIIPDNNFDKGIDTICNGILNQRSFIYEE